MASGLTFLCGRFRSRTPGPPPFSSMNSRRPLQVPAAACPSWIASHLPHSRYRDGIGRDPCFFSELPEAQPTAARAIRTE